MAMVPFFTESSSLDKWDPNSLWDMMFEENPNTSSTVDHNNHEAIAKDAMAIANTHVDWFETLHAHIVKADLPGLCKNEIEVIIEDERILQISGRKKVEDDEYDQEGRKWHRAERRREGGFLRRLKLPAGVKADENSLVLWLCLH
ncbi:hypothetical protein SUGI_0764890 [Cryptomeria japonica]|nr:hypothetical protein SUGI_0764890 [Cryptomeria japonica]